MIVNEDNLPYGWSRAVGNNTREDTVTVYTNESSWFDIEVWNNETEYTVKAKRGPKHPRQDEIDEPLREHSNVRQEKATLVAIGFMLCAGDMDPFTNKFTRGTELE